MVRPQTCHADRLPDGQGRGGAVKPCLATPAGSGGTTRRGGSVGAAVPTPPYQFIAIARTIARGFTEQAIGHPDGEALTEAAQAIWRGIEVLEGMDRRALPRPAPCGGRCQRHRSPLAGTVYKGQGRTITQTYLLHTRHWHSTSSYVALTRQTEQAEVFVSRQSASDVATLAQQMGRSEERGASLRWHVVQDVGRLQAAVVANDQDIRKAKGTAEFLIRSAYRDSGAAAERLSALVERDGWQQAASQVSADPTILGQLAGRDGFLAGARSRGDRLAALKSIDSAITWTGRLPQLTERAIERRQQDKAYSERAEQAYAERDAVKDASSDRQYQRAAAQERERRQDRGQGMER